ncbi:hypothetical protein [Micromonospora sp. NPDC000442]|uniref:hypothetical protein n=1 Tax=Micromonospora sp. NPDC000442 TaxID=3364217 RepID=UPI0036A7183A
MTVPARTRSSRFLTPPALAVGWFCAALVASALGAFRTPPGDPPVALALAAGVPPLTVLVLAVRSSRFRAWARRLDLRFLTLLQTWRVAGLAFLALATVDALPAGFALPAGIGDVAIGLSAPLVAAFVVDRANRLFVFWTALGIADLILAVTLGVLYSASPAGLLLTDIDTGLMSTLPMSLVPAFGVPVTLVAHLLSLINLSGR